MSIFYLCFHVMEFTKHKYAYFHLSKVTCTVYLTYSQSVLQYPDVNTGLFASVFRYSTLYILIKNLFCNTMWLQKNINRCCINFTVYLRIYRFVNKSTLHPQKTVYYQQYMKTNNEKMRYDNLISKLTEQQLVIWTRHAMPEPPSISLYVSIKNPRPSDACYIYIYE